MKVDPKISRLIKGIEGKEITKVIAGGSNGSIVVLRIGEEEFSLFIKCIWRLEDESNILTGWNESNDAEHGNLTLQMKKLSGDFIKSTELSGFYDLKLHFLSGKTLNIFCDVTPHYEPEDYDENWLLCDIKGNRSYVVKKDFLIADRPYS